MKTNNVVQQKSYDFAKRIVNLYKYLIKEHKEYELSKQVLNSGTSIAANIEECIGGQTNKDFFSKMCIAYKEARETHFWIRLLRDTDYIKNKEAVSLLNDLEELLKINRFNY
jgi:four helix bundle protein